MPVFLSHKSEDKPKALAIRGFLQGEGVTCYLDVLDPELQSTDDITSTIVTRVGQCTHLMAVVSHQTGKSWWVPFEIGVATETSKRISTFQTSYTSLPDFLKKWPIMKTDAHLREFVRLYRLDTSTPITERRHGSATIHSADQFHRSLKAAL